ncbi:hypothetical protein KJ966_14445 [bacterium]|nr:hypothetical protein [bacterium]
MEKGDYKTGQLLGVKEKNGKMVQEYVAGFFGDEPIIKQRLLTPQESRRYREDLQRAKQQGKSPSEAANDAGARKSGLAPERKLVRRTGPGEPGAPLRKRKIRKVMVSGPGGETPMRRSPMGEAPREGAVNREMEYIPEKSNETADFIQNLINGETDKTKYNPANTQKAMETISRISCPDMKIYRFGTKVGDAEGESYTQKEYIARNLLGLPIWKPKPEEPEKTEPAEVVKVSSELSTEEPASTVAEAAVNDSDATENAEAEVEIQEA